MGSKTIATTLEAARREKGLSQRALSAKVGLPQSQISKIESGLVDARLSTVMEIARALDLELSLIPRTALPAMQALGRAAEPAAGSPAKGLRKVLLRPAQAKSRDAATAATHPKRLLNRPNSSSAAASRLPKIPMPAKTPPKSSDIARGLYSWRTPDAAAGRPLPAYRLDDDGDDDD